MFGDDLIRAVTKSMIIILIIIATVFVFWNLSDRQRLKYNEGSKLYPKSMDGLPKPQKPPTPPAPSLYPPAPCTPTAPNRGVEFLEIEMLHILEEGKYGDLYKAEQRLRELEEQCLTDPRFSAKEARKINELKTQIIYHKIMSKKVV